MAECGEYPYSLIEQAAIGALNGARLLSGIIEDIDRGSNTADVTISELCPYILGKDTTAIPFFYHCEYSTGTDDDLINGHYAFDIGDEVYVLLVPPIEEYGERLFVIGHVDMRSTESCSAVLAIGDDYEGKVWEKKLSNCTDVSPSFVFLYKPTQLQQVKYDNDGEPISLFHYIYSTVGDYPTTYMAVTVVRGGKKFTVEAETGNSLQVYGALSEDFSTLYVVISTSYDGITRNISYTKYVFSDETKEWAISSSGTVDCSAYDATQGYITVSRAGLIHAASDYSQVSHNEYEEDSDICVEIWPDGEFVYYSKSGTTTTSMPMLFDIESATFSHVENSISHGIVVVSGDYSIPLSGQTIKGFVLNDVSGGAKWASGYQHIWYTREQEQYSNYTYSDVKIEGSSIGVSESGIHRIYSASVDSEAVWDNSCGSNYRNHFQIIKGSHEHHNGIKGLKTIGGWCIIYDNYINHVMVGDDYDEYPCQQNVVPCPPWGYGEWNVWTLESSIVERTRVVWPAQFECYSIANAFSSYDNVSGDWYYGAFVNDSFGGDFYWKIYKNGDLITDEVEACTGNLITTDFSAIYFR